MSSIDKIRVNGTDYDIGGNGIINQIYPVGSIYMSVNSTSPATLFGGTWEQIKDKFILSAGDTYSAGSTGGSASQSYTPQGTVGNHTLTTNEIPSHTHTFKDGGRLTVTSGNSYAVPDYALKNGQTLTTDATGGGQAHNHSFTGTQATLNTLPPYLAIYVWKRTA